jgi:hypothetical protein
VRRTLSGHLLFGGRKCVAGLHITIYSLGDLIILTPLGVSTGYTTLLPRNSLVFGFCHLLGVELFCFFVFHCTNFIVLISLYSFCFISVYFSLCNLPSCVIIISLL